MLETPKAHIPKRNDEISISVTVTKVEKSYVIVAGCKPKQYKMDNQQPRPEQGKVQRLSRKGVGIRQSRKSKYLAKGNDIVCTHLKE